MHNILFFGALIGHGIDWLLRREKHPEWFWYTIGFWALSIIVMIAFHQYTLAIVFPFAYGIFFTGSAFVILIGGLITLTYAKLYFDLIYTAIFVGWLWLTLKEQNKLVRRILLFALFAITTIGMVGCASQIH